MSAALDKVVEGLLNGKQPSGTYLTGKESEQLATALSDRIDSGVAPSLCAHAMCASSAAGNVAVVRMLSSRPMSTFNKAYNFGEPLRRACRAYVKAKDELRQRDLAECARLVTAARGDINQPDKYLKSGMSAAGCLKACGTTDALQLLDELVAIQKKNKELAPETTKGMSTNKKRKIDLGEAENRDVSAVKSKRRTK